MWCFDLQDCKEREDCCKRTGWDVCSAVSKRYLDVKTAHTHTRPCTSSRCDLCCFYRERAVDFGLCTLKCGFRASFRLLIDCWDTAVLPALSHIRPMQRATLGGKNCMLQELVGPRNVLSFINLCVQQSFAKREEEKWKADGREHLSDISHQRTRRYELLFRPVKSLLYPEADSRRDLLAELRIHQELGFRIQEGV